MLLIELMFAVYLFIAHGFVRGNRLDPRKNKSFYYCIKMIQ